MFKEFPGVSVDVVCRLPMATTQGLEAERILLTQLEDGTSRPQVTTHTHTHTHSRAQVTTHTDTQQSTGDYTHTHTV